MKILKIWNQQIKKYFSLDWKKNQYKIVIDVIDRTMVVLIEKDGMIVGNISFADMHITLDYALNLLKTIKEMF